MQKATFRLNTKFYDLYHGEAKLSWDNNQIELVEGKTKVLSFNWDDITAWNLTWNTFQAPVLFLEPGRTFVSNKQNPKDRISYLFITFYLQDLPVIQDLFNQPQLKGKLRPYIPSWLFSPPFEKYYRKEVRDLFNFVNIVAKIITIVCFSYELMLRFPAPIVETLMDVTAIVTPIYDYLVALYWSFYDSQPVVCIIVSGIILLVSWPVLFFVWPFLLYSYAVYQLAMIFFFLSVLIERFDFVFHNAKLILKTGTDVSKTSLGILTLLTKRTGNVPLTKKQQ